jgi:hypothetical protein
MSHHDERRRLPRRRTRLSAVAVHGPDDVAAPCTVRDRSETGARLLIPEGQVPDAFHLLELTTGDLHRAQVVWRDDHFVGVTLHDSFNLASAHTPEQKRFADLRARLTSRVGAR